MNGEELKTKRKSKGWTQSELAQKIGVSKGTVINYEKGKKIPESKTKILTEVFSSNEVLLFPLSDKLNILSRELREKAEQNEDPSKYILEYILPKFHPAEIVAYQDRNRDVFLQLEEFGMLASNIVGESEIEYLKKEITAIKKRLDQS